MPSATKRAAAREWRSGHGRPVPRPGRGALAASRPPPPSRPRRRRPRRGADGARGGGRGDPSRPRARLPRPLGQPRPGRRVRRGPVHEGARDPPRHGARAPGEERGGPRGAPPQGARARLLAGRLGAPQPAERPESEQEPERERETERGRDLRRLAGDEAPPGLEDPRQWIHRGDGVDPALEQRERHVHRREEERQEDGHLHDRAGLHRAQSQRDAGRPEHGREVDHEPERVEAHEVDASAPHLHPGSQGDRGHDGDRDDPADEGGERVAEHDPAPLRRGEEEPARETALEVARDPEPREHAAEGGRLEQHEDELEGGVAGRKVESRHLVDPGEPAGEGDEEEEREDERWDEERRVREDVVQRPPRHRACDREPRHARASLERRAKPASVSETSAIAAAIPKPSASASASQPVMMRLRTHSSRYETGFAVARARNQSTAMRSRGSPSDETKRKTKKSGKTPCTASPEPVRRAMKAPSAPKPSETMRAKRSRTSTPATPAAKSTPTASPAPR